MLSGLAGRWGDEVDDLRTTTATVSSVVVTAAEGRGLSRDVRSARRGKTRASDIANRPRRLSLAPIEPRRRLSGRVGEEMARHRVEAQRRGAIDCIGCGQRGPMRVVMRGGCHVGVHRERQ